VVRDNRYGAGGDDPQGMLAPLAKALGGALPPIVWDGVVSHRAVTNRPSIAILEPSTVGFIDLGLNRTPVDLQSAKPSTQRPRAVAVREPEPVVVPQDPL
jgi:hypothetical protein